VPTTTGQSIDDVLASLITFLAFAYLLILLVGWLKRSRPELKIHAPVAVAFVYRVLAAGGVSLLPIAGTLRGGDEEVFLGFGGELGRTGLGSGEWESALTTNLPEFVVAVQTLLLDSPEFAMRITQAGIAVAGLVFLAVAVHELAGPRAALLTAWVLALEPANVFFSTLVHKEANMILAGGLVAFGGASIWKRPEPIRLLPMIAGCLVAVATRPYAGWFLIAASAAIILHAALRARLEASFRSLILVAIVVLFGAIAAPTVLEASTDESLTRLQVSQGANVADQEANLALEEVDFSTRGAIVTNLPIRIRDMLFRPYPWQLGSTSQQLAVAGSIVFLTALALLLLQLWRSRGAIMARAGPFVYLAIFLLIAYSLSVGNAGTAFRYRTHILMIGLGMLVVVWFVGARASEQERTKPKSLRPELERWGRAAPVAD
jgi:hypothetical protein